MRSALISGGLLLLALGGWAGTTSWVHLQFSGVTEKVCTVKITLGSEVFILEDIPVFTAASQICEDFVAEVNSARHGHLYHAASNGVDESILSIIADGSPISDTTPWLGMLVPEPRISIEPSGAGLQIRRTNIQNTMAALAIEGEEAEISQADVSIKVNGQIFTLHLAAFDSEKEEPEKEEQTLAFPADYIAQELSGQIDADPGFRSNVLMSDTGQLLIFITGANVGGGVNLQDNPKDLNGLKFTRSRDLFASQTVRTVALRR
jgi:hypothetical protein